jgi:quercetin dioxygenase-like cupin family protein
VSVPDHEQGGDPACWLHLFEDEHPALVTDLVDIGEVGGAVWSLPHGGDLDANLVRLAPSARIAEHVNRDVDVLVVVRRGGGELVVGGTTHALTETTVAMVPRDSTRSIRAGADGLDYLSIHRRRDPMQIGRRPAR